VLDKFPDMLAAHLLSRLLPDAARFGLIRTLLSACDGMGPRHNALLPLRHCLASPGGPLKYALEGHNFAIFGCSLTADNRYVISISTRWAIKTLK
jgi:hypothetical protein